MAVPVLSREVAVASVSVFGPSEIIKPDIERLVPLLTAGSNRITKHLGG